jgi:hypothetical protein
VAEYQSLTRPAIPHHDHLGACGAIHDFNDVAGDLVLDDTSGFVCSASLFSDSLPGSF